jgi:hypothetical protein
MRACLSVLVTLTSALSAFAGQVPGAAERPDIAVSERDRFYTSDQFSNTVSVIHPASNKLLGVIRLGDPTPSNLSPLYRSQLLVHYSPCAEGAPAQRVASSTQPGSCRPTACSRAASAFYHNVPGGDSEMSGSWALATGIAVSGHLWAWRT